MTDSAETDRGETTGKKAKAKASPKAKPAGKAKGQQMANGVTILSAEMDDMAAALPDFADDAAGSDGADDRKSMLKLKELVERVLESTGAKRKGVREIVEATLEQLSVALAKGEALNLPGLGKVRVQKTGDRAGTPMLTLKVKGGGPIKKKEPKEPQEPLAEPEQAV